MNLDKQMLQQSIIEMKSLFGRALIIVLLIFGFASCGILKQNDKTEDEDPRIKAFNFNYYFLEANKQKALGNFEEALIQYSTAYQVDDQQAAVCYEIAGLLNLGGDYTGAVEYAEKAVELDETNNEYYRLLLAYVYQNNSQYEKAAETYKYLVKEFPDKINYYFELASIYTAFKNYKDAIKVLNSAENKFGINETIALEKEVCYQNAGMKDEAVEEIKKLSEAYPDNAKYKTLLAESYVNAGKYDMAEEVYTSIDIENVSDGIVFFSMADFYRTKRDYDNTFKYLTIGMDRDDVELDIKVRMMLQLLEVMGQDNKMIGNISYILELLRDKYPEELKVRALTSDFYLFTKDYEAAQEEFDFLLAKDKSKYQIWEQALQVDFILNDMESMYLRSKEATELYPNVIELYRYRIISAYATEEFLDVTESVDYVSVFMKNDVQLLNEFLILQGDSFHKLNMHYKSDSVYELVLDRDAENTSVLNNYSYFLAERNEKLDRAMELSTKLVELDSENPIFLDTHAWVLYKNGEYEEALKFIGKAIVYDLENQVYFNHQGDILYKLDKIDEAIKSWEKSVEYGNDSDEIKQKIENKRILE